MTDLIRARGQAADSPFAPYAVLAVGVVIVSTASILIRFAHLGGASSLTIAALRLTFATLVLTPYAWPRVRTEVTAAPSALLALPVVSGLVLALHFATWITSLEYTSVASSAVLVTTNPIWVGLAAWLWLKEPLRPLAIAGIALGMAGGLTVFVSDAGETAVAGSNTLLGNGLALVGALAASAYLLIGRRVRDRLSLLAYVWIAYGTAAVALLVVAAAAGRPLIGLPAMVYVLILALALGPQLIGHTTFNWAIRRLPAPTVAMAILGEPVGAALLAWWLFDETASTLQLAGFALLLAGIYLTARAESAPAQSRHDPG